MNDVDFGPLVRNNSYLELWWLSCLVEQNHLGNLAEGNMRNIPMKLFWFWNSGSGDVMPFKDIFIYSSGGQLNLSGKNF